MGNRKHKKGTPKDPITKSRMRDFKRKRKERHNVNDGDATMSGPPEVRPICGVCGEPGPALNMEQRDPTEGTNWTLCRASYEMKDPEEYARVMYEDECRRFGEEPHWDAVPLIVRRAWTDAFAEIYPGQVVLDPTSSTVIPVCPDCLKNLK